MQTHTRAHAHTTVRGVGKEEREEEEKGERGEKEERREEEERRERTIMMQGTPTPAIPNSTKEW